MKRGGFKYFWLSKCTVPSVEKRYCIKNISLHSAIKKTPYIHCSLTAWCVDGKLNSVDTALLALACADLKMFLELKIYVQPKHIYDTLYSVNNCKYICCIFVGRSRVIIIKVIFSNIHPFIWRNFSYVLLRHFRILRSKYVRFLYRIGYIHMKGKHFMFI